MGLVLARRPDGIGTRLLTILHARRLAERLGYDFKFMWPSLSDPGYDYSGEILQESTFFEIFCQESIFSSLSGDFGNLVGSDSYKSLRWFSLTGGFGNNWSSTRSIFQEVTDAYDVILYDQPQHFKFDGENTEDEAKYIHSYWKEIGWQASITEAFKMFANKSDLANCPAIHMRRGDISRMTSSSDFPSLRSVRMNMVFQRYLPLQTAFDILQYKLQEHEHVVICSEDPNMIDLFTEGFPTKAFSSPIGLFDAGSNQQAVLDLLVLSNSKCIVSPFKSYYSECAAAVSQTPLMRSNLDVYSLVNELIYEIDLHALDDQSSRKVLVLVNAWKNLWYEVDSPRRAALLLEALTYDAALTKELIGEA